MALAYWLNPAVQSSNAFDFQPQIFIPITFFSMYYCMLRERWKLYFLFVFLSLMIEEHVAIILLAFSLATILTRGRLVSAAQAIRKLQLPKLGRTTQALLATIILSISGYFASRLVRESYPLVPQFVEVYRTTDGFHVLGSTNDIVSVPFYALMNPARALEALSYDLYLKVLFVIFLFAPLLFLSLRSRLSIVAVVLLLPFLLSNYPPYYMLGAQYPLYFVPLVFLAAVESLKTVADQRQKDSKIQHAGSNKFKLNRNLILTSMVILTFAFSIFLSPISPLSTTFTKSPAILWYQEPYSSENYVKILHEIVGMIPPNASVLTQNNIFPHLSSRTNAYVIPTIKVNSESAEIAIKDYVRHQIDLSDFVLLDNFGLGSGSLTGFVLDELEKNEDFRISVIGQSAVLFERGQYENVSFMPFGDYEVFVGTSDFVVPYAETKDDTFSSTGRVVFSPKGATHEVMLYGPYTYLPRGVFEITFQMKFGKHDGGYLGMIDVSENYGSVLSKKELYGSMVPADIWTNYTITVSSTNLRREVEFRVFTTGLADVYVDKVIVKRVSS